MSRLSLRRAFVCALVAAGIAATPSKAEVRIVATDAGFEAPATVAAGLRHIVFENRGREIHEAMLVKLPEGPEGMTAADYVAAVKKGALFPEGAIDASGPGLHSPGETTELWRRIDPGSYVLICWNFGHSRTHGVHAFTAVDRRAPDDTPPKVDVVVKLVDYAFELSRPLRPGTQVLRFETAGPSMHEADIFRLNDGKSASDLLAWRDQRNPVAAAPAVALGGVLDSHDLARPVWIRRTFTPGRYVLLCQMPMNMSAKAGTAFTNHADAGMVHSFEIAKE